jgi:hypothetical protein
MTTSLDVGAGIPVVVEPYPEGEEGIQKSLAVICRKIREGMASAAMKSFAGNVLKLYGFPEGVYNRTAAVLDFIRRNVAYAPDALGTEQIQSAAITLCVNGAPVCIPVGDCFPEGTLLLRRDGQLVPIEEINVGDEIWGDKKWSRVEGKAFKGKLFVDAVEMNNGSTMYLTPDHKVYVGRCKHGKSVDCASCGASPSLLVESWERIRVGDLRIGESLLQPERIAFNHHGDVSQSQIDRLYVEGLAISEGWVDGNRFCISGQDGKRKEVLKHEVKSICDRIGVPTTSHRKYIRINDPDWATRVASFGHLARNKHFETLNLSEPEAAAVLRGIMSDSTANTNGSGRTFSTTSYKLMVQVRVLHRMFGRSTSVKMLTPEQHRGAGKHPLWRVGVRVKSDDHKLARNEKTLAVRSIERAVKKVPCWDIQTDDHKVYLPEHDVTVSNCDDLVTALGTLLAAIGMEVRVVRQIFGGNHQQHVLIEVKDEHGRWLAADPSSKTMPVGKKAPAVRETYCSPWDPEVTGLSGEAMFVGIGSLPEAPLPVLMLSQGAWRQVDHLPSRRGLGGPLREIAPGIEVDVMSGDVRVGTGACCESCAKGLPCEGCAMATDALVPVVKDLGLAGVIDDTVASLKLSLDLRSAAKQLWASTQGSTWGTLLTRATTRARSKSWDTSPTAQADLTTLALSTAFHVERLEKLGDPQSKRVADALNRTLYILLKRIGKAPQGGATVSQYTGGGVPLAAEVPIAIVIALAITVAVIYVAFFAFLYYVLRDVLAVAATSYECDREMIRLHAEVDQIAERHQNGEPYSAEELERIAALEDAQKSVLDGCVTAITPGSIKSKPPWDINWKALSIGAGIVGIAVLGVIYAPEIRRILRVEEDHE